MRGTTADLDTAVRELARPVSYPVGTSPDRPDGPPKTKGEFAYSSDLWAQDMLWGRALRSPHPYARIRSLDIAAALAQPGVHAVLTHEDVPGRKTYGLLIPDQPVLAHDVVRFQGEPVALVAADHPETARRALDLIKVDYEPLEPVTDPEVSIAGTAPPLHPEGNIVAQLHIRHGDVAAASERADVTVTGTYELGMQDQAFLGPESGLALPSQDGGVELFIATQWLHADREQMAASLGLSPEKVRLTSAGIGGAFGGREDLSIQIHACLLALHTGRPIKMSYGREESFFGHVHRHPGRLEYEHGATRDGILTHVKARVVLDGGAYASTSREVIVVAATTAAGPYAVDHAEIDAYSTYTNNPPCGAMRGFGAVQSCFGYESQMDKLAAALDMDPVELRRRNVLPTGGKTPTGQVVDVPVPVRELLDQLEAMPLPPAENPDEERMRPGGVANTTHGEGVRRGVGYAVGFKNIGFSSGADDYSTARVRLSVSRGELTAEVHTAGLEVGQGLVVVQAQIARTELGVDHVLVLPADTQIGNAGSSSASRQSWLTGGAVQTTCAAVAAEVLERTAQRLGVNTDGCRLDAGQIVTAAGDFVASMVDIVADEPIELIREYHARKTTPLDANGQGDPHWAFAFAAHRAVVDVDVELGLVRVIELAVAQDVGKALNPKALEGQIEGGSAQGLGLALMEEIQVEDGCVRNPSFTDYLVPTILDVPPMRLAILELPTPHGPYGLNGAGEPPTISSTPAVVAAVRAATGMPLPRVPVRPTDIVEASLLT
ncbi:MAG: xanthine dehydrogenase subunit D [Solirubrobacteraceae bacterium]|nr:xanthine dehydrogenase subunit D [Solirubrobacteraceae bacterium]